MTSPAMGYLFGVIAAQVATVSFILWPVFRIARRVGHGRRYAWILCILCAGCSFAMSGLNVALYKSGWIKSLDFLAPGGLLLLPVIQFTLSPFVSCVLPLVYFSFQKWPLEAPGKEADIFG